MGEPRAAQILTALRRLGYVDKPGVGDHFDLHKLVSGHPDGKLTMTTGLDMGMSRVTKADIGRIKRETCLKEGDLWKRVLAKKLGREEYDEHLRSQDKWELVNPFFREKVKKRVLEEREAKKRSAG